MLRDEGGHADTEVDVEAVFDFPCGTASDVVSLSGFGIGGTERWGRGGMSGRGSQGCKFDSFGRGCVNDSVYVDPWKVDRVR